MDWFVNHESIVLVWYDFALTFGIEVQRIWQRRFSGATIIYLIIRYTMLSQSALYVISIVLWRSSENVRVLVPQGTSLVPPCVAPI